MSAQNCIMCTCVRLCAPHAPMDELWFRLHDELGICALPPGECRAQIVAGQKHTAAYGAASTHFQLTIIWFHRVFAIDGGSEQNIACSRWFVLLLHSATALCSTFLLFFVFGRCFAHCGSVFHHQHLRNNMFLCIWHSFFFFLLACWLCTWLWDISFIFVIAQQWFQWLSGCWIRQTLQIAPSSLTITHFTNEYLAIIPFQVE